MIEARLSRRRIDPHIIFLDFQDTTGGNVLFIYLFFIFYDVWENIVVQVRWIQINRLLPRRYIGIIRMHKERRAGHRRKRIGISISGVHIIFITKYSCVNCPNYISNNSCEVYTYKGI